MVTPPDTVVAAHCDEAVAQQQFRPQDLEGAIVPKRTIKTTAEVIAVIGPCLPLVHVPTIGPEMIIMPWVVVGVRVVRPVDINLWQHLKYEEMPPVFWAPTKLKLVPAFANDREERVHLFLSINSGRDWFGFCVRTAAEGRCAWHLQLREGPRHGRPRLEHDRKGPSRDLAETVMAPPIEGVLVVVWVPTNGTSWIPSTLRRPRMVLASLFPIVFASSPIRATSAARNVNRQTGAGW
jgi:hypothetical protein